MFPPVVLLYAGLAPLLGPNLPVSRPSAEAAQLQGTWLLHTVEWQGERTEQFTPPEMQRIRDYNDLPAELREVKLDPKRYAITLTFTGDRYVWRGWGRVQAEGTFRVEEAKRLKVMRTTGVSYFYCGDPLSCAAHASNEASSRFIYRLQGDHLEWCVRLAGKLATRFEAKEEDVFLLVFTRLPHRPRGK